jgi:glycosyltransferase involved in cell wall biosynthesis
MISIVIPVKNGGADLRRCLEAIACQDIGGERVEIVIVDSGSTDDSLDIARAHHAVVREILPEEFTHGASRNIGAAVAGGELLVFISQDAFPIDDHWLARLTAPLRADVAVGGVYGRQLPHAGARPPEVFFLDFLYGPNERRQRAGGISELNMETTLFSNVNAAMPRALWERFPFVEDIIMSEDQDWSRRVLLDGFAVVYEPLAAVRHSHNYTLSSAFGRFFDSGVSAERAYLAGARPSSRVLRAAVRRYARSELGWLWRTGQRRWIPYAVVYEGVKLLGLVLGSNHRYLPRSVKQRLSGLPSFWARG